MRSESTWKFTHHATGTWHTGSISILRAGPCWSSSLLHHVGRCVVPPLLVDNPLWLDSRRALPPSSNATLLGAYGCWRGARCYRILDMMREFYIPYIDPLINLSCQHTPIRHQSDLHRIKLLPIIIPSITTGSRYTVLLSTHVPLRFRSGRSIGSEHTGALSRLPSAPQVCSASVASGPCRHGRSWRSLVGGLRFLGFSVQVCWSVVLVAAAALLTIMSPRI